MTVSLRRATAADADFLLELADDDDVRPFLGAHTAADRARVDARRALRPARSGSGH